MNTGLIWDNLTAYSLQIGLLVGVAAFIPTALRLHLPKPKLWFWYLLLATCLALPAIRPWRQEVAGGTVQVSTTIIATGPMQPVKHSMPRSEIALLVLAAGVALRLAWLAAGFWKLRRYRRHSHPLDGAAQWRVDADLRISEDLASPVTFGYLNPVILLPAQFPDLEQSKQDAILCHEVLHVWRHDWLFTVAEELVRALFWFHPAIWWVLGEIQLAREQAVDQEVIALTSRRDEYVDALLAIAGAPAHMDLAPAPLFLRKRHLKQRVVSILKEVRMSKTRMISAFAMSVAMLAAACWFVTGAFPLAAAPQTVSDGMGVAVDMNGAALMHRSSIYYPQTALKNHVEGTVVVQVKLGPTGEVVDASVLSGPDELRKGVISSVLDWHFSREAANGTRQVTVTFALPKASATPAVTGGTTTINVQPMPGAVAGGVRSGVIGGVVSGGVVGGIVGGVPSGVRIPSGPSTLKSIVINGLSDQARSELVARLPVHEGDVLNNDLLSRVQAAVRDYDEHLSFMIMTTSPNESTIQISAPRSVSQAVPSVSAMDTPPGAIRVGGNVQQSKLVRQPRPVYPALAKEARISGVVHLNALLAKDGTVSNLSVISGHPLLVQAAMDAVRQWVYEPTVLNGNPVEVVTQIDVNFTLTQ
jgi:TonB family protein